MITFGAAVDAPTTQRPRRRWLGLGLTTVVGGESVDPATVLDWTRGPTVIVLDGATRAIDGITTTRVKEMGTAMNPVMDHSIHLYGSARPRPVVGQGSVAAMVAEPGRHAGLWMPIPQAARRQAPRRSRANSTWSVEWEAGDGPTPG